MSRILLVEDDLQVSELVGQQLRSAGYVIDIVNEGTDGAFAATTRRYDLIILDWELPGLSGLEILRELRSKSVGTPVLMLTGKSEIAHKESGLDAGADDYLTKPFATRELTARVRALLRRSVTVAPSDGINFENMRVDCAARLVFVNGAELDLFPREYLLLEFLVKNHDHVFTASELIENIWPMESGASDLAVRTVVSRLRSKLEASGSTGYLETIRGLGYKLTRRDAH